MRFADRLRQERLRRHLSQETLAEALGVSSRSIHRWEQGKAVPQASLRLQLSRFFGLSPEVLFEEPGEEVSSLLWSVPYPRNPFFTGREEILSRLHELFHQESILALTQSLALSGLGGVGKTQVALEYAYHYRQNYDSIFWISAATREGLLADVISIADRLRLPERNEQDQQKVLQAVKHWFDTHQRWLWILDNADDITVVHDVLPAQHSGHILLTSRAQALGSLAQPIEIETMGIVEGTLLLLRRARLLAADAFLDQVTEDHLAPAEALVLEMDCLPLALDQAGAYIEEVGVSLSSYLNLYRAHRKELLQRRGHLSIDHPASVVTTWSLNFQKVEQANPVAADLLRLCAYLSPDAIPEELISEGSSHLGSVLGSVAMDAFKLNEAIGELRKFSLVQRHPETRMVRIHRLVQAVLKDTMEIDVQIKWAERVVHAVNAAFPEHIEANTWVDCQRYLPQAQACSVLIQDYAFTFEEAAALLYRTAMYLQAYALYEQAGPLLQQALRIRELRLGAGHPDVARVLNAQARLYQRQGQYEQAGPLYQQALRIWEQYGGPDHPDRACPLVGLGSLFLQQSKYEQAELLLQQGIQIRAQTLGHDHPDMAQALNILAELYDEQGRYEQAGPLYQQALRIWEQHGGSDHPNVAQVLNNLATLYYEQGQYEQAESMMQRALSIWEQRLGPDHTDVAQVLNNLSFLYREQGQYEQAEPLLRRALAIWEQRLGPEHSNVAFALKNMAVLFGKQGKYAQAESFHQRSLQIREQTLGADHPMVASSLTGLANLYREQRKDAQAEALYQRALRIREQASGPEHPDTAETLHDFALFREAQGRSQEAASLYRRALMIREHALGITHPKTDETRTRLQAML